VKTLPVRAVLLALLISNFQPSTAYAQSTAFTYQGELNNGGSPASGLYDFQFTLYDASINGNVIADPVFSVENSLTNGLFTSFLDFGSSAFNGNDRWLQIGVRPSGTGNYTLLTNRQQITSSPYAIQSLTAAAANSVSASNISGTVSTSQLPQSVLTNAATAVTLNGTFTGNGGGLSNVNASQLSGTLSTNVPELNANQFFTGANTFSNLLLQGTLNVKLITTLNSNLTVSGIVTVNDGLNAFGNTTLNGGLNVIGGAQFRSGITVTSSAQFNGNVTANSIQFPNGFSPIESQEILRTIRGTVSAGGTVLQGSGFTVNHVASTGSYQITFSTPFSGIPSVVATAVDVFARAGGSINTNSVTIGTLTSGGAASDDAFNFIAVGPP
jgi:hypothetical protein